MRYSSILVAATALAVASAIPMEVEVVKREYDLIKRNSGKGTEKDPYILDIDCDGVQDLCEARCMGWLCAHVPNPYKWIGDSYKNSKDEEIDHAGFFRKQSGMASAFTGNNALKGDLAKYTSAEETLRASSDYNGFGVLLVAVTADENTKEGSRYSGQLAKYTEKKAGSWVKDNYSNYAKDGFCEFFYKGKVSDGKLKTKDDYCKNAKKTATNVINRARYNTKKKGAKKGTANKFEDYDYGKTHKFDSPGDKYDKDDE